MKPLLTVHDAYEALGCDRWTIFKLLKSGELKGVRLGKAIRIPRECVEELICRRELEELRLIELEELRRREAEAEELRHRSLSKERLHFSQARALERVVEVVLPSLPLVSGPVASERHEWRVSKRKGTQERRSFFDWRGVWLFGTEPHRQSRIDGKSARAQASCPIIGESFYLSEQGEVFRLSYRGRRIQADTTTWDAQWMAEAEAVELAEIAPYLWDVIAGLMVAFVEAGAFEVVELLSASLTVALSPDEDAAPQECFVGELLGAVSPSMMQAPAAPWPSPASAMA